MSAPQTSTDISDDIVASLLKLSFRRRTVKEQQALLQMNRPTPRLPIQQYDKDKMRSFNSITYDNHDWLCGSVVKNTLYCWPCLLVSKKKSLWNSEGFMDLKNVRAALRKHNWNKEHLNSYLLYKEMRRKSFGADNLNKLQMLSRNIFNREVKNNLKIFRTAVEAICLLSKHDYRDKILNGDTLAEFVKLALKPNLELEEHWQRKGYFESAFDDIIEATLNNIELKIIKHIRREVCEASFYVCFVDDVSFAASSPRCSISLRYIDDHGEVRERLLGFFPLDESRTGEALCELILNVLEKFDAGTKLLAYTCDGACVSTEELRNLQTLMKEKIDSALFTHCLSRPLPLIIQQSCSHDLSIRKFFAAVKEIEQFFKAPLRRDLLNRVTDEADVLDCYSKLVPFILNEKSKLTEMFDQIVNCYESDTDTVWKAGNFKNALCDSNFEFYLKVFEDIFQRVEAVSNALRQKTNSHAFCIEEITKCLGHLERCRDEVSKSCDLIEIKEEIIQEGSEVKMEITEATLSTDGSASRDQHRKLLDIVINQLRDRFSAYIKYSFHNLADIMKYVDINEDYVQLVKAFPRHFSKKGLKNDMDTISNPMHSQFHGKKVSEVVKLMVDSESTTLLPKCYNLYSLLTILPSANVFDGPRFTFFGRLRSYLENANLSNVFSPRAWLSIERGILEKFQTQRNWYDNLIDVIAKDENITIPLTYV